MKDKTAYAAVEKVHKAGEATIKDSGIRRLFTTGANRDGATGKGLFHLLPYQGLLEVAQVFEAGAAKYTKSNWRLGMPLSVYADSGIRHAMKAGNGWSDENHAAMAVWNFLTLIETRQMIKDGKLPKELDDLPDWLTSQGVEKAFAEILEANAAKAKLAKEAV